MNKQSKHDFLRRTVTLCLWMMAVITVSAIVMGFVSGIPPDSATIGVLMGGWCGELLLALLKRKFEQEDVERKREDEKESKERK